MAVLCADNPAAPAVAAFDALLGGFLQRRRRVKEVSTIEPALNKSDFDDLSGRVSSDSGSTSPVGRRQRRQRDQGKAIRHHRNCRQRYLQQSYCRTRHSL
ncbi:hypothetical protein NW754_013906 [Fusarium falciforme]|nr:hypothetical protein NW754_013906 [Fusarium falciforme]